MKKQTFYFIAGAMIAVTACTSTDTTTDSTTASTSETTRNAGTAEETGTTTGGTMDATGTTGTTETTSTTGTTGSTGTTEGTTGTTGGTMDATGTTGGTTGATGMGDMTSMTNMDDATFLMTAASSNLFEIEAGNMAMKNATDQKVKDFARMMVDHHTKANQELKTMASNMGTQLPETLMPMHQAMIKKLSGNTGEKFDESYMDTMETAHKMDITMFEAKSKNATDQSVKSFAAKTLPILEKHHSMATDIEDTVD